MGQTKSTCCADCFDIAPADGVSSYKYSIPHVKQKASQQHIIC
jgi:hypothetical protein